MNKQQEKAYREYNEALEAGSVPLTKEEWLAVQEQIEKEEHEAYLAYQIKVGENNSKLPEGKEPEKILTKEDWIKKGKPTGETKHERFVRLVEARTERALDAIEKLFALKGANYESSEIERKQVIEALQKSVKNLENHYTGQKEITAGFKLQTLTQDQP